MSPCVGLIDSHNCPDQFSIMRPPSRLIERRMVRKAPREFRLEKESMGTLKIRPLSKLPSPNTSNGTSVSVAKAPTDQPFAKRAAEPPSQIAVQFEFLPQPDGQRGGERSKAARGVTEVGFEQPVEF